MSQFLGSTAITVLFMVMTATTSGGDPLTGVVVGVVGIILGIFAVAAADIAQRRKALRRKKGLDRGR